MPTRFGSWPQYDGKYVVLNADQHALKVWATTGTTNAAGALTITVPAGAFTTVLGVTATAVRDTTNPTIACFALVRSYSTSQVVVQVFESKTSAVLLLGANIEGLEATTTATPVLVTIFGV